MLPKKKMPPSFSAFNGGRKRWGGGAIDIHQNRTKSQRASAFPIPTCTSKILLTGKLAVQTYSNHVKHTVFTDL